MFARVALLNIKFKNMCSRRSQNLSVVLLLSIKNSKEKPVKSDI
jgi:hypothetical protein